MGERPDLKAGDTDAFVAYWSMTSGAERANYQLFLEDFCRVLALPLPGGQMGVASKDNYVFERSVEKTFDDGTRTTKFIDLYKKGCFVLKAKQSSKRRPKDDPDQLDLLGSEPEKAKAGTAKRGTAGWDTSMLAALNQAREYAHAPARRSRLAALPADRRRRQRHRALRRLLRPGQALHPVPRPPELSHRASDDLADDKVQERLRAVWSDPLSLDPTKRSAEVTRDIAERLARIARSAGEGRQGPASGRRVPDALPFHHVRRGRPPHSRRRFADLLERKKDDPATFKPALEALWKAMNDGGYAAADRAPS